MRADAMLPPRPTPEDLEDACRETEHTVLTRHRQCHVPLILWRDGRVVKLTPTDPDARAAPGTPPAKH